MAKTIRAARHYQDRDSPVRRIADAGVAGIKRDVKQVLMHLGTLVPDSALQFARAGDWHGLRREIAWGHFREVLKAPFARIGKVREAGAQLGARKINGAFAAKRRAVRFRKFGYVASAVVEKDVGDRFTFDLYDQKTQDRIRRSQDDLIQQLDQEARDSIAEIVLAGAQTGLGPDEIVEDIRSLIGLTDRQARAVMNYQRMLYELDPDALERRLRNTDHDQEIQDAIDSGDSLTDAAIDAMTADYAENYLDYRAENIAQTESTRAANAGLRDAYSQAVDRGALPSEAITRFWQLGDNPCPICESIPDANPDGVGLDEDFDSDDGPQDDPPVHTHCFCSVEYVTDLDKVLDDGEDTEKAFNPDQPRDERGRWTSGGSPGEKTMPRVKAAERAFVENRPARFGLNMQLSDEQKLALSGYTGSDYNHMNGILRGSTGHSAQDEPGLKQDIAHLRSAIDKSGATTRGGLVYRGVSSYTLAQKDWTAAVGSKIKLDAFTSTSSSESFAKIDKNWAGMGSSEATALEFRIYVPAGTKALDVSRALYGGPGLSHEHEVILQAGSAFYVRSAQRDLGGRWHVDLILRKG